MWIRRAPGDWCKDFADDDRDMGLAHAHLTVADEALAAYERALAPKKLVTLGGGHFDAYVSEFATASGAAARWFSEHLLK
jgi:fermentation-respiration switch protein FrsA (DUF1100 family)